MQFYKHTDYLMEKILGKLMTNLFKLIPYAIK